MNRADGIVLVLAAALIGALYAALWTPASPGETARVHIAQEPARTLALDSERTVTVNGALGPSTLEVRDGQIRFTRSPCRGKVCIHTGWIATAGEIAACVPNRVSVSVRGQRRFDAINF